ncbi:MAG: PH domain-containing protein [Candidatus Bathyarchaeia archaeon]
MRETAKNIPKDVKELLDLSLSENEEIICSFSGDIDENGNFGEVWLFLTTKRIITINPVTKNVRQINLNDVRSSFVKDYLGNSELLLETNDGLKSVIRFSRERLEGFYNLAKLIDKIAKGDIKLESVNPEIFETLLSEKSGTKKTQALLWLMGFLKPYITMLF